MSSTRTLALASFGWLLQCATPHSSKPSTSPIATSSTAPTASAAALETPPDSPCTCAAGRCVDGSCFIEFAKTKDNGAISIVRDSLYWRSGNSIVRAPLDGSAPPTVVVTSTTSPPVAFTVGATDIRWTSPAFQAIASAPLAGGPEKRLATGYGIPREIASDAQSIYFTSEDAAGRYILFSLPFAGGAPTPIARAHRLTGLQTDGVNVFFADGSSIECIFPSGMRGTLQSASLPMSLVVSHGDVIWSDYTSIAIAQLDTGAVRTIHTSHFPMMLAASATHVYWYEYADAGSIVRAPRTGGPPRTIAKRVALINAMVASAAAVWWTTANGVYELVPASD